MAELRPLRWRPVQFAVFVLMRFVACAVGIFRHESAPALARVLASVFRRFDVKHGRIAAGNLERAGYGRDAEGIVRRVYENFTLMGVEMLMTPRFMRHGGLSRFVRFHRMEIFDGLVKRGRGLIVVIGHLGNWELAGLAITMAGRRIHSLARPIENPYLNRWALRARTSTGQIIVPKRGAMPAMAAILRRGEILVVQVDQDARASGVMVEFFGRPASTVRSPAILALRYGVPILPVNIFREGPIHHLSAGEPILPEAYRGRPDAVREMTQAFTSRLEGYIRRHPDQWNWLHRRWKTGEAATQRPH